MEINVNLANQPYVDSRPIIRGLRISILCLGIATVAVGSVAPFVHKRAEEVRNRGRAAETSLETLHGEQREYQNMMHSSHVVQIAAQTAELNRILDAKAFSWTAVMQDLETVLPSKVQVTAMEPARTKDGTTSLHLRVIGPHEKSIDLLRNLEGSKRFFQPRIVGESLVNNQGSGQKSVAVDAATMMEFDLMVDYDSSAEALTVPSNPNAVASKQTDTAHLALPMPQKTPIKATDHHRHGGAQ